MENQDYKVRVEHLTKYFGPLHVLDDVSFNIKKGEFLCVVGPTGCGKTTFLNLLTRIYMPTRGQLYIDNEPADPKKHNVGSEMCIRDSDKPSGLGGIPRQVSTPAVRIYCPAHNHRPRFCYAARSATDG